MSIEAILNISIAALAVALFVILIWNAVGASRSDYTAEEERSVAFSERLGSKLGTAGRRILVAYCVLCATAMVPYVLGRFAIRDSPLYPTDAAVFDHDVRQFHSYVVADYLGGIFALSLILSVSIAVLIRTSRSKCLPLALMTLILALAALKVGRNQWAAAELGSRDLLISSPFPAQSLAMAPCHVAELRFPGRVWTGVVTGNEKAKCSQINIYRGWQLVGTITKPDVARFVSVVLNYDQTYQTVRYTAVGIAADRSPRQRGYVVLLGGEARHPADGWRRGVDSKLGATPGDLLWTLDSVVAYQPQSAQQGVAALEGIRPEDGTEVWRIDCGSTAPSGIVADTPQGLTIKCSEAGAASLVRQDGSTTPL